VPPLAAPSVPVDPLWQFPSTVDNAASVSHRLPSPMGCLIVLSFTLSFRAKK
jgi:hypothetical protein